MISIDNTRWFLIIRAGKDPSEQNLVDTTVSVTRDVGTYVFKKYAADYIKRNAPSLSIPPKVAGLVTDLLPLVGASDEQLKMVGENHPVGWAGHLPQIAEKWSQNASSTLMSEVENHSFGVIFADYL